MKRYMPTFTQAADSAEQWKGMTEDSEGEWYSRVEADARIDELDRALKSCAVVISQHLKNVDTLTPIAVQALQEADKALSL